MPRRAWGRKGDRVAWGGGLLLAEPSPMQHVSESLLDEKSSANNPDEYSSRYVRREALL